MWFAIAIGILLTLMGLAAWLEQSMASKSAEGNKAVAATSEELEIDPDDMALGDITNDNEPDLVVPCRRARALCAFDGSSLKLLWHLPLGELIGGIAVSPTRLVATSFTSKTVVIVDIPSLTVNRIQREVQLHGGGQFLSASASPSKLWLFDTTVAGSRAVLDLESGSIERSEFPPDVLASQCEALESVECVPASLRDLADGPGRRSGDFVLTITNQLFRVQPPSQLWKAAIPRRQLMITGGRGYEIAGRDRLDQRLRAYDLESGRTLWELPSPEKGFIATASKAFIGRAGWVEVVDAATGEPLGIIGRRTGIP
ncbi:MAG: hypothetical protein JNL21_27395 [Myxococcales bacterium]|nr:hypothetical protein [Myxococcales bacterium]